MPQDIIEQKVRAKRFELLVPVYGLLLVVSCLLMTGLPTGQAQEVVSDWLKYLPYG